MNISRDYVLAVSNDQELCMSSACVWLCLDMNQCILNARHASTVRGHFMTKMHARALRASGLLTDWKGMWFISVIICSVALPHGKESFIQWAISINFWIVTSNKIIWMAIKYLWCNLFHCDSTFSWKWPRPLFYLQLNKVSANERCYIWDVLFHWLRPYSAID